MRRRTIALIAGGVLLLAATPLIAQALQTGRLTIAGELFAAADVLDARAMPDVSGTSGIMLTLTPRAAQRLAALTAGLAGKPMVVALDGKPILREMIRAPIHDGVIDIPGAYKLPEAEALAKRISGKPPLPEDLAE
jgi:preprotein translocase subunit SecD